MGVEEVEADDVGVGAVEVDLAPMDSGVRARLAAPRVTPEGFVEFEGFGAAAGVVQVYPEKPVGEQRHYRPATEVFDAESLASWAGRPFSILHPHQRGDLSVLVTPTTARVYSAGSVMSATAERDLGLVRVKFLVTDAGAIAELQSPSGPKKLSAGYNRVLVRQAGVAPSGEVYEVIQTKIRINHLAAVQEARAGTNAGFRDADSKGGSKERTMEFLEVEVGGRRVRVLKEDAPVVQSEVQRLVKAEADAKAAEADAKAKAQVAEAKAKVAEADAAATKAQILKAETERERAAIKALVPGASVDALDLLGLKRLAVREAFRDQLGEAPTDAVVDAAYPKAVERLQRDRGLLRTELGGGAPPVTGAPVTTSGGGGAAADGAPSAREAWLEKQASSWQPSASK